MDNPCPWLPDLAWDNVTELDKLTNFHGLITSFEQYPRDWNVWYTNAEPETAALPGEWDNACNELQRMLILRSLRQDRVSFCVTTFIINNLGSKFVEPPVLDMQQVVEDSTTRTPLIFVLSAGVVSFKVTRFCFSYDSPFCRIRPATCFSWLRTAAWLLASTPCLWVKDKRP